MDDKRLAVKYAPLIHYDKAETIPLCAVGYTVFREEQRSDSFPKRSVVPDACGLVIEYALFWDYDIQHMYDLEHIWVWVAADGSVTRAEASFHGKYLNLWEADMGFAQMPEGTHVHAYCQPGKHAFLPDGQLFRLLPGWRESCNVDSGGAVLVGGPFGSLYAATAEDDARCKKHIREKYAFEPTLEFDEGTVVPEEIICPWEALKAWIPSRIAQLCDELKK
ncbi:MAG: hypothetical protein IJZ74_10250 [Clostridia bacterium]|nr:hypothetical protein [Clostridia bacterium]